MRDPHRFDVTEAAREPARTIFAAASVQACLDWVRGRRAGHACRVAIWPTYPPPDDAPDVAVCFPVSFADGWRGPATDLVQRWDDAWLLIESAPRAHRAEARDALVELVAIALAAAASVGPREEDVGF